MAFLDKFGLRLLWAHIEDRLSKKIDKVDGKGLSTNDYTDEDKNKLAGLTSGGGGSDYVHPTYTQHDSGLYKITVDSLGHVSGATAVAKSDITALGIPEKDTTYSEATTSQAGLMSASDKLKLNNMTSGSSYADGHIFVEFGALPNATIKSLSFEPPVSMTHIWVENGWGRANNSSDGSLSSQITLPYASAYTNQQNIQVELAKSVANSDMLSINVQTQTDYSRYTGYFVLGYKL